MAVRREPVIALVGMPGGGKSTVGRQLAKRLGCPFSDLDTLIEREIGCSIRSFFEHAGEARFREIEAALLAAQLASARGVLATGGGTVVHDASRALLRSSSIGIYLRSTPEELYRRLRRDTHRPLLQVADPARRLRELYAVRDPLYREAASFVFETGRPSVPALADRIAMQLELAGVLEPPVGS